MTENLPEVPFTVEDWSYLHPRLLWCYEGLPLQRESRLFTEHHNLSAWWMLSGTAMLSRGRRSWRAGPGEWLFSGAQPHYQEFTSDARILSVNFKLEWSSGDSLVDETMAVKSSDFPELCHAGRELVRFVSARLPHVRVDLWKQSMELVPFLELQKLFSAWVLAYIQTILTAGGAPTRMSGVDPRVLSVLQRLERHPWDVPFQEKDMAREIGLSAGHLDRLFLKSLGLTPRAYLQKRRLESASALLADTAIPIKRIAYNLGFCSPSHFCHWFQNTTGKSPKAYRQGKALP